jgi:adenylate cyclase
MADVITAYQGTIDEFIGDAIFVIFGAPIQRDDDAERAVACALAMQLAMGEVNDEIVARGLKRLEMGIGINTGGVVVGNIGSTKRMKYGVVGSHVNLTSRIESYTVGGQILISENTLLATSTVRIGKQMKVATKGFSEPVSIYAVEGIGAPHHLTLPTAEEYLVSLDEPISLQFTVLDGKYLTGEIQQGRFVKISTLGAVLETEPLPELLANLKITIPAPFDRDHMFGDLYAKVVEADPKSELVRLRFTAVPEDVAAVVAAYCYN